MGASQRRKGHDWEREVARRFQAAMPGADIRRGLQSQRGGAGEADVVCPLFHVECKAGKQPSPRKALAQAFRDGRPGQWPVAVMKDDRKPPFVCLRLDDFLELVEQWWRGN